MKKQIKISLAILLLITAGFTFHSSDFPAKKITTDIIVSFVTYNAFGNNLYLDNLMVGKKPDLDLSIISINNVGKDTTFVADSMITLLPDVVIFNAGKTNITDSVYVTLTSRELNYTKTDTLFGLQAQYTAIMLFDSIVIPAGTSFNFTTYTSLLDSNSTNDTIRQYSCYLKGADKKILLEEFTSNTSIACAGQNPYLDSFVYAHSNNINAIKYHLGFPQPGIDSMYLADTTTDIRARYYSISSVPNALYNGRQRLGLPYSYDSIMQAGYDYIRNQSSPLALSAHDTLLAGDTIQSTIDINILYNLPGNNYKLQVYALEKNVVYQQAPGTNGESIFRDVFRRAYPDFYGTSIPIGKGSYRYIYKYHIESFWNDTSIYTIAFVQNNDNHEVLNSATGKTFTYLNKNFHIANKRSKEKFIPDFAPRNPIKEFSSLIFYTRNMKKVIPETNSYYELFEYNFPPKGWVIQNNDESSSFEQILDYNGVSLGGIKCVRMPFYEYSNIGAKDVLTSVLIPNITEEDTLSFDYAYAQYLTNYADSLSVMISTDGGNTFTTIFNLGGKDLATAPATTLSFAPSTSNMWKTFYYPMSSLFYPGDAFTGQPAQFELQQNYPNPFNPSTTIYFKVLKPGLVTLKVYDITGRMIKELFSGFKTIGSYPIVFNSSGLASGIYFYRMTSGDNADTKKMVIIK